MPFPNVRSVNQLSPGQSLCESAPIIRRPWLPETLCRRVLRYSSRLKSLAPSRSSSFRSRVDSAHAGFRPSIPCVPAGLETKGATQIVARASDPHRGLSTRSFTRESPRIVRPLSANLEPHSDVRKFRATLSGGTSDSNADGYSPARLWAAFFINRNRCPSGVTSNTSRPRYRAKYSPSNSICGSPCRKSFSSSIATAMIAATS